MTYEEIYDALQETDLPVTFQYWKFPSEIPSLPYIVFDYPENDDFIADNSNYVPITVLDVRLYTQRKDFETESTVESVLSQYFNPYSKSSEYVSADSMQETIYTMEVVITHGEQN